jgi:hypothetical protein
LLANGNFQCEVDFLTIYTRSGFVHFSVKWTNITHPRAPRLKVCESTILKSIYFSKHGSRAIKYTSKGRHLAFGQREFSSSHTRRKHRCIPWVFICFKDGYMRHPTSLYRDCSRSKKKENKSLWWWWWGGLINKILVFGLTIGLGRDPESIALLLRCMKNPTSLDQDYSSSKTKENKRLLRGLASLTKHCFLA